MTEPCFVCGKRAEVGDVDPRAVPKTCDVKCVRCGEYVFAHASLGAARGPDLLEGAGRARLSHVIRKANDAKLRLEVLSQENVKRIAAQNPLPDAVDQADMFIDSIARKCSYGELTPVEHAEAWCARIGLQGIVQLRTMQEDLDALVTQTGLRAASSDGTVQFSLTLRGWRLARELRQQRGPGNQAFVAMWFHGCMDAVFDDGFAPALEDTGHAPYRVDRAAHNNNVDDEIIAQIRRSKLVVVDASGARPNAYWEAGFAKGLRIPVIWCCNESWRGYVAALVPDGATPPALTPTKWSDVLPFDTRQQPFVLWKDPANLRKKLTDKIRALGLDTPWNRGQ